MATTQTAQEVGLAGAVGGAGVGTAVALGAVAGPVGALVGLGIAIVESIFSISAHHDQAVKTEAAALNDAVARFQSAFSQITAAVNAGQVSPLEGSQAIDASLSQYDSLVYQTYGVKKKSGNGADVVKGIISGWASGIKNLFASGAPGTYAANNVGPHAGFNGVKDFAVTYSGPTAAASSVSPFNFSNASQGGGSSLGAGLDSAAASISSELSQISAGNSSKLFLAAGAVAFGVIVWRLL